MKGEWESQQNDTNKRKLLLIELQNIKLLINYSSNRKLSSLINYRWESEFVQSLERATGKYLGK